jgi:hypothetical protein
VETEATLTKYYLSNLRLNPNSFRLSILLQALNTRSFDIEYYLSKLGSAVAICYGKVCHSGRKLEATDPLCTHGTSLCTSNQQTKNLVQS